MLATGSPALQDRGGLYQCSATWALYAWHLMMPGLVAERGTGSCWLVGWLLLRFLVLKRENRLREAKLAVLSHVPQN